jgi:hypothetical protein
MHRYSSEPFLSPASSPSTGPALRAGMSSPVSRLPALALPAATAYAEVAGLSPVHGLYALLLPALACALFGSSRQLILGSEGSIAALIAAAVLPLADAGSDAAAE